MDRYELTAHAMREEVFPGYLIYGRWDWVFGCWLAQSRNGPLKEIVPTWPLLAPDGSAAYATPRLYNRDYWEPTADRGGPEHGPPPALPEIRNPIPQAVPGAVAALHGYLDLIPADLRALIAPLGRYQWLFLDAVQWVPGFEVFARREIETKRVSFIVTVWCVAAAHLMTACGRRALNRRIMTEPRRQLIESILAKPLSPAAMAALYKFEPAAISTRLILQTMELLASASARHCIALTRKLSPAFMSILSRIPDWMALPNVLNALSELAAEEGAITSRLVPDSLVNLHSSQVEAAARTLQSVKTGHQLLTAIYKIEQRTLERAPFPAPPIRRHGLLVALASSQDLKREARAMRNCIASYTPAVMTGSCFLLSWLGAERGTVELVRDGRGGWTLGSVAGHDNAPLALGTVKAIVETLAAALDSTSSSPFSPLAEAERAHGAASLGLEAKQSDPE